MIWSVKQACTRNLSTYIHKTDPDLCARAYTHGTVYRGGPCRCTCRYRIFKSLQDPFRLGEAEKKRTAEGGHVVYSSPLHDGRWWAVQEGGSDSATQTLCIGLHIWEKVESHCSVWPLSWAKAKQIHLSTVPKYQLQSGAMMTSALLSQLFNLCLSDQQWTSKGD